MVSDDPTSAMLTVAGEPVWPVRTARDLDAVARAAEVFGAVLVPVASDAATEGPAEPARDEDVVALGPGTRSAASMYAHLTRRRFRVISRAHELDHILRPAVVVMLQRDMNNEVLERVAARGAAGWVTGIIAAPDRDAVWRQSLVRAIAAASVPVPNRPRVDVWPLRTFDVAHGAGRLFFGSEAPIDLVQRGLALGASVTHVFTHSDGIDAFLGPGVLCALAGDAVTEGSEETWRAPRCRLTGQCHRLELPVADARQTGLLVSPSKMRARVLVWSTCLGVVSSDWVVGAGWSIAMQLLDNPAIGAIVTTWSIGALDEGRCRLLADRMAGGASAGASLTAALHENVAGRPRLRMCLFGDPATRAVALERPLKIAPGRLTPCVSAGPVRSPCPSDRPAWQVDTVGVLLANSPGEATARGTNVLAHTPGDVPGAWLQQLVGQIADLGWAHWLDTWTAAYRITEDLTTCSRCGGTAVVYDGVGPYGSRRHYWSCGRCARFDDIAEGCEAGFDVRLPDRCELSWEVDGAWAARLRVSSAAQYDSESWAWPVGDDDRPLPRFRFAKPLPVGPLRISAILASGFGLSVLTHLVWHGPSRE